MLGSVLKVLGWLFGFWDKVPEKTKQSIKDAIWSTLESVFTKIYDDNAAKKGK